jgi:hypothetical protein
LPETHIQAHSNQLGASNPTAVPWNVLAPRPMHLEHIIYQWLPNHGLLRVHHKHSEPPARTCECRRLSRKPTLSHADLMSLGPSFYSIYRAGWRTAHHMPRAKMFSPTPLFYFLQGMRVRWPHGILGSFKQHRSTILRSSFSYSQELERSPYILDRGSKRLLFFADHAY